MLKHTDISSSLTVTCFAARVDVSITFSFVECSGGDENGTVTSIGEIIMEQKTKSSRGCCWTGDLLVGYGFLHDFIEIWTGCRVVI